MRDIIDELTEIHRLRQLARGEGPVSVRALEAEYIGFSGRIPDRALAVRLPRLYELHGDESTHLELALKALGITATEVPAAVDISGAFGTEIGAAVIFLSMQQLDADHHSYSRSRLNPLIQAAYANGSRLISDFSIHEAIMGRVECMRGDLRLDEVHLFPQRFQPGAYQLSVTLDTPKRTITELMGLEKALESIEASPKLLLERGRVMAVAEKAVQLRTSLGSLSRYQAPEQNTFTAETNSYTLKAGEATLYYLYSPSQRQNIVVVFGQSPFREAPREIMVLDGQDAQQTLKGLLERGVFGVSVPVLEQRIAGLEAAYESLVRAEGIETQSHYPNFSSLVSELSRIKERLSSISSESARRQYALRLPADMLEFIVYPDTRDPVVHELLPRLSQNRAVRAYNDTERFMAMFEGADAQGRASMLRGVQQNILFRDQQNNDVNVQLYQRHRQFCEDVGVKFEVVK